MPNGGVPISLILRPKESDVVFHCKTSDEITIYDKAEWEEKITSLARGGPKEIMKPIAQLTRNEVWSIVAFVNAWYTYLEGSVPKISEIHSKEVDFHFADE